jgi:hypothetical protein
MARFDAGARFDRHAIEFHPFAINKVLTFAALQLKVSVSFQRQWRRFAGHRLSTHASFGAGILPGERGPRWGLGADSGAVREQRAGQSESFCNESQRLRSTHAAKRANVAPDSSRYATLNLEGLRRGRDHPLYRNGKSGSSMERRTEEFCSTGFRYWEFSEARICCARRGEYG